MGSNRENGAGGVARAWPLLDCGRLCDARLSAPSRTCMGLCVRPPRRHAALGASLCGHLAGSNSAFLR